MMYRPGDRVRFETTGDDGWPLIRYGFVGGVSGNGGPIVVMLDGELSGDVVNRSELQPVTITSVELLLRGSDLIDDPDLRRGLVALWHAEADSAGLDVGGTCAGGGLDHGSDGSGRSAANRGRSGLASGHGRRHVP